MTTPSSRILKIGRGCPTSQSICYMQNGDIVICKMEPPCCFSCKIDILWVVPFLQNKGDMLSQLNHVQCHMLVQSVLINVKMDFSKVGCRNVLDGTGFGTHPKAELMLALLKLQVLNIRTGI